MNIVAMIDPPWPQRKGGLRKVRPNQNRSLDYPTMDVYRCLETVESFLDKASIVFIWTIDKFLHDTEVAMFAQGFTQHARLIWNKTNGVAPAFTVRFSHEYLLWFYKKPMLPINKDVRGKFTTVFEEKATTHSTKPNVAYEMIEALYPDCELWDIYARRNRNGWRIWPALDGGKE